MSWDLHIYGGPLELLPGELVEVLRERGVELQWRPRMRGRPEVANGYFVPTDRDGPPRQIRIHVEPPEYLEDLTASDALTPEQRSALHSATSAFWIVVDGEYDDDWAQAAAEVVAEIAKRTGGVILDVAANRLYGLDEWRQQQLGGGRR